MISHIDHVVIMEKIAAIYKRCSVTVFPLDCFSILKTYGFRIYTYGQLSKKNLRLYKMCIDYSNDAFRFEDMIAYNERKNLFRIRFSLMHELGHFILKHKIDNQENEAEADYFASHILAPRIIVHKGQYRTADDIHLTFGLSYTAANRVLLSYRTWYNHIAYSPLRQPSEPELQLEKIFFPKQEAQQCPEGKSEEKNNLDLLDKYIIIYHLLQKGLPIPRKYSYAYERYRKTGFKLK